MSFWPVGREDVQRWRLFAQLVRLLHRDGQRLTLKQLLVLDGGAAESLPHRDVLKRHWKTHTVSNVIPRLTSTEVNVTEFTKNCIGIFSRGVCLYDLCQVKFISTALYLMLIVSKQLHRNKIHQLWNEFNLNCEAALQNTIIVANLSLNLYPPSCLDLNFGLNFLYFLVWMRSDQINENIHNSQSVSRITESEFFPTSPNLGIFTFSQCEFSATPQKLLFQNLFSHWSNNVHW